MIIRAILARFTHCTRNLHVCKLPGELSLSSTPSRLRCFSSNASSLTQNPESSKENDSVDAEVESVSNEEFERRVKKFMEGDEGAIPSIFEGILQRKLAEMKQKEKSWAEDEDDIEETGTEPDDCEDSDDEDNGLKADDFEDSIKNVYEGEKVVDSLLHVRDMLKKSMHQKNL